MIADWPDLVLLLVARSSASSPTVESSVHCEDRADLLQPASFLQDKDTYARAISCVAAAMARGFKASRQPTHATSSSECVCAMADITAVSEPGGPHWALDDETRHGGPSCPEALEVRIRPRGLLREHLPISDYTLISDITWA